MEICILVTRIFCNIRLKERLFFGRGMGASKHCTFCDPVCVRNPKVMLFLVFTYSVVNFFRFTRNWDRIIWHR